MPRTSRGGIEGQGDMRVVRATALGGPEVLEPAELPDPVAGPGEVVVKVAYSDTLFVETQIRAGAPGFPVEPPYVPGGGIAGTVLATGDGVDPSWSGRRVVTTLGWSGGYAEQAVAAATGLVPVPGGLGLREAAALVHDSATAMALTDAVAAREGETVLILGATGGMGVLLVQLVRATGARVLAGVRGERKLRLAAELGADPVDVSRPDWPRQVSEATAGAGADAVLDGVGGAIGRAAFEVTADGGRFSAHGTPAGGFAGVAPEEARRRGIDLFGITDVQFDRPTRNRWTALGLRAAAEGRIRPIIGQTFPLARAADAHAAIEARTVVGKTLLEV
ncbi:zinc-binding dehydrogenase [Marinactinospora rubrisoli]|uniref:Zinc-binding dehydrogenase n=1 Tax=Marinactinospora rubrisoli TaxID=2715399 RepID=A0ABW2KEJ2_9ACTN